MQQGGKTIYGATLGILMLETRFPRIPGDIGNAGTWPFPVQFRIVRGATPDGVVRRGDTGPLVEAFVAAGQDLVASGCDGVATNCGFLAPLQSLMADRLNVPFASSSLMQCAAVQAMLPRGQRVGIVTISAETLTGAHLTAAGVPDGTPIIGTDPKGEFADRILGDASAFDVARARTDVIEASRKLVEEHPDVGAIVLECTNMVPFAGDVRAATGRAVFSIYTYLTWFQGALLPRRFRSQLDDATPV